MRLWRSTERAKPRPGIRTGGEILHHQALPRTVQASSTGDSATDKRSLPIVPGQPLSPQPAFETRTSNTADLLCPHHSRLPSDWGSGWERHRLVLDRLPCGLRTTAFQAVVLPSCEPATSNRLCALTGCCLCVSVSLCFCVCPRFCVCSVSALGSFL